MNKINWYPGHMAKTRRLLSDQLKSVDLVIELCDARLPFSSRNPDLDQLLGGKKRILMLNKADLADPGATEKWLSLFRKEGLEAAGCSASRLRPQDAVSRIEKATREAVERAALKGVRKTVRVMVAGVPNVGKSTFINRIHGKSIAATGDRPGVTKSNQWIKITPWLELLDTPGMLWPRLDDQVAARRLCYIGSVKDDVIDLEELALCLLNDLAEARPESLSDRFHVQDASLRGVELMEEVCRGRGFLLRGGEPDYDRCSRVVLDEFRAGKTGRITLEMPGGGKEEAADEGE